MDIQEGFACNKDIFAEEINCVAYFKFVSILWLFHNELGKGEGFS